MTRVAKEEEMHAGTCKKEILQAIFASKLIFVDEEDRNEKTRYFPKHRQSVRSERFIVLAKDEGENHELPKYITFIENQATDKQIVVRK